MTPKDDARWKTLVVPDVVREKLPAVHDVSIEEARQAFEARETPEFQRISDRWLRVYTMLGTTQDGRELLIVVEEESPTRVCLLTAYDPTQGGEEDDA